MRRIASRLCPALEGWLVRCAGTLHTPEGGASTSYAPNENHCLRSIASAAAPAYAVAAQKVPAAAAHVTSRAAVDPDHARRLDELLRSGAGKQHSHVHGAPLQHRQRSLRPKLDLGVIPMLRTPSKKQLQQPQHEGADEKLPRGAPPAVDWRDIVERARRTQDRVSGAQMLTDTFRCANGVCIACAINNCYIQWACAGKLHTYTCSSMGFGS